MTENNIRFFKVGGAVRDSFLNRKNKDVDFAVEAPSFDAMRDAIVACGGKIFLETPEFFTIRAKTPDFGSADFVLCRKDGAYRDGRHPESVTVGTIEDDLARRDFTINAMAINAVDGRVIDPHNGLNDCANRVIRCVGNPETRFNEDALRVFRALRFAITLRFTIAQPTAVAIGRVSFNQNNFANVSTERIREELFKMFEADSICAFRTLDSYGLNSLVRDRGIWFKPTIKV